MTASKDEEVAFYEAIGHCGACFYAKPDFENCIMYCLYTMKHEPTIVNATRIKACRELEVKTLTPYV